jgi:hypothetical protein
MNPQEISEVPVKLAWVTPYGRGRDADDSYV